MNNKTPEQITNALAAEAAQLTPGSPERTAADTIAHYCGTEPTPCAHSREDLTEMLVTAITADRKQHNLYELTAQALDDRSDWDDGDGERAQRAAAHLRAGTDDHIWDRYFGPLLDDLMTHLGNTE